MSTPHDSEKKTKCEVTKAMKRDMPTSRETCLICKGSRMLCGRPTCPLLDRVRIQTPIKKRLSASMAGPAPSIFVGHRFYPDVFVGPMAAIEPEKAALLDDPSKWYGMGFDKIIEMRSLLVRSRKKENVRNQDQFIERSREVALSVRPTEVEIDFKVRPAYKMSFSSLTQPMGPTGPIKDFRIAANPKIPRKVDSFLSDEVSSQDVVCGLYKKDLDVYYLSGVLSSGALGFSESKKMVPTRWSITAIDDIVAKDLMKDIREYPRIKTFEVYENTYLENHFEVLLIPGEWGFEQFEAWAPKTLWTQGCDRPVIQQEHEGFTGRTKYAEKEGGGYYAGRLAVAESLYRMRRQAKAVIFREIYEGYVMPVGVWEVRENVRHAMQKKPGKFQTLKEALADISRRLRIPVNEYLTKSQLLKQRKITDYL